MMFVCAFCQEHINPNARNTYRRVTGWEHRRDAGGTNAVALRETHEEFAHSSCITLESSRRRSRIADAQESFRL